MAQFMLLLHESPEEFAGLTEQEMKAAYGEYRAWHDKLSSEGKLVSSHKLKEEGGRHLVKKGGQVLVTDGPYAESKEVLGGYFIVQASSYDEAVEIAKTGPHVRHGRTEIRQVDLID